MAATELATAAEIEQFFQSALVSWIELFVSKPKIVTDYRSLLNGTIFVKLWSIIDSNNESEDPFEDDEPETSNARIKNFQRIVECIQQFYQNDLQQTLLRLPNSYILGVHPESKAGLDNLKLLLILILGAAVQCQNKEIFVERIKELDLNVQYEVVQMIKEVTDSENIVLNNESFDHLSKEKLYECLKMLESERNVYYTKWISSAAPSSTEAPNSMDSLSLSRESDEISCLKEKCRKLQHQLDEKSYLNADLKCELECQAKKIVKLQSENQELLAKSKETQAYQDELDALRENVIHTDQLKSEVQKLREKLSNTDYYKAKMDELQGNNQVLHETKIALEEQVKRIRIRCEQQGNAELEVNMLRQKLDECLLERRLHEEKVRELMEENQRLRSVNYSELNVSETEAVEYINVSISDQLKDSMQSKLLALELENSRLQAQIDQTYDLCEGSATKDNATSSHSELAVENVKKSVHPASIASKNDFIQDLQRQISSLACQQMANEMLIVNLRKVISEKSLLLNTIRTNLNQLGLQSIVFESSTNEGVVPVQSIFTDVESFHRFVNMVSAAYSNSQLDTSTTVSNQSNSLQENRDTVTFLTKISNLESKINSIQKSNFQLVSNKEKLLEQIEIFKQNHRIMARDQNRSTRQYERLLSDYESILKDRDLLKQLLNHVKEENVDLKGRIVRLEKSNVEEIAVLKAEHSKLTEDFCDLYATCDQYRLTYDSLKTENNALQGENDRLKGQINELSSKIDKIAAAENDYSSLADRCEMLMTMNSDLTRERRVLMDNVSQLLGQYHELLSHSIEDKQHYHESCQNYLDKVSLLSNQKERLEMKIMDQYKTSESATKKKENSLIKRMKKASSDFINKVPTRSRKSWIEDTNSTPSKLQQNDSESISPDSEQTSGSPQHSSPTEMDAAGSTMTLEERFEALNSRRTSFISASLESSDDPMLHLNFLEAGNRMPIYANQEK